MANKVTIELVIDGKKFTADLKSSTDAVSQGAEKMATGLGKAADPGLFDQIKSHWLAISATVLAVYGAISKAKEYMQLGAMAEQVETAFRTVAAAGGESADRIIEGMKRASAGTVDESNIMQKALKGMALELSGNQMIRIMEAARVSARVAGEDVQTAYEKITDAIATNMPRTLKQYGLITKEEMGLVNKALAAGIEDVNLYEIAMAHATLQTAKMGEILSNAAEQMQRSKAQWNELAETIGKSLLFALQKVTGSFQAVASESLRAAASLAKFLEMSVAIAAWTAEKLGFTEKAAGMREFGESVKRTAEDLEGASWELALKATANINGIAEASTRARETEIKNAEKIIEQWEKKIKAGIKEVDAAKKAAAEKEQAEKAMVEAVRKAQLEIDAIGLSEYEKDLKRIDSEVEKFRKAKVAEVDIQKFAEKEKTAAGIRYWEKTLTLYDTEEDSVEDTVKAELAIREYQMKQVEKMWKDDSAIIEGYMDEEAKAIVKGIMEQAEARRRAAADAVNINKSMVEDINKFTGNEYETKVELLNEEYKNRQRVLGESATLEKWYAIERKKLDEAEALRKGTFWAGMRVAYEQDLRAQKSWGERGAEIWRSIFGKGGALESTLAGGVFDAMKGHLKSLGDYWESFKDLVLRAIAQMIAQWLAFQAMLGAGSLLRFNVPSAPGGGPGGGVPGAVAPGVSSALGAWLAAGGGPAGLTAAEATAAGATAAEVAAAEEAAAWAAAAEAAMAETTAATAATATTAAATSSAYIGVLIGYQYQRWHAIAHPGEEPIRLDVAQALIAAGATEAEIRGQTGLYVADIAKKYGVDIAGILAHPYTGYEFGGVIYEPIYGIGKSGRRYAFGEGGPEEIKPLGASEVRGRGPAQININSPLIHIEGNLIADEDTFNAFVEEIDYRLTKIARREFNA